MDYRVAIDSQLSAHLRSFRKARGLTQTDLGQLLGVKQSRVADIERDPGAVSASQLLKVLSALGVRLVLRDLGYGWSPATEVVSQAALSTEVTSDRGARPPKQRAAKGPSKTVTAIKVPTQSASQPRVAKMASGAAIRKLNVKTGGSW